MSEEEGSDEKGLGPEEIEAQGGEELPDRIAMSLVDANVAIPIDAAIAADVLADESVAEAAAEQDADVEQES